MIPFTDHLNNLEQARKGVTASLEAVWTPFTRIAKLARSIPGVKFLYLYSDTTIDPGEDTFCHGFYDEFRTFLGTAEDFEETVEFGEFLDKLSETLHTTPQDWIPAVWLELSCVSPLCKDDGCQGESFGALLDASSPALAPRSLLGEFVSGDGNTCPHCGAESGIDKHAAAKMDAFPTGLQLTLKPCAACKRSVVQEFMLVGVQ